jgi:hypothetical protein
VYPRNLNATRLFYLQEKSARRGKGKKERKKEIYYLILEPLKK